MKSNDYYEFSKYPLESYCIPSFKSQNMRCFDCVCVFFIFFCFQFLKSPCIVSTHLSQVNYTSYWEYKGSSSDLKNTSPNLNNCSNFFSFCATEFLTLILFLVILVYFLNGEENVTISTLPYARILLWQLPRTTLQGHFQSYIELTFII